MRRKPAHLTLLMSALSLCQAAEVPVGEALATIDSGTADAVVLVDAQWRYTDAEGQPGSEPNLAYDIRPHAGGADFDDSQWILLESESLAVHRRANRQSDLGRGRLDALHHRRHAPLAIAGDVGGPAALDPVDMPANRQVKPEDRDRTLPARSSTHPKRIRYGR